MLQKNANYFKIHQNNNEATNITTDINTTSTNEIN